MLVPSVEARTTREAEGEDVGVDVGVGVGVGVEFGVDADVDVVEEVLVGVIEVVEADFELVTTVESVEVGAIVDDPPLTMLLITLPIPPKGFELLEPEVLVAVEPVLAALFPPSKFPNPLRPCLRTKSVSKLSSASMRKSSMI